MGDEFVAASKLGKRIDDPRLSVSELESCVEAIAAGITRANRKQSADERATLKCQWVVLLGRAGRRAPTALVQLAELLEDRDARDVGGYDPWWESVAERASDTLVELGAPAIPLLIGVLERGTREARVHAARALERIGAPAREWRKAPALQRAARDPDEKVRVAAAQTLSALLDDEDERMTLVGDLLRDAYGRHAALVVAWKLADRLRLLPELRQLLTDPDPAVRSLAANHIQMLHEAADSVTPALIERFQLETNLDVRLKLLETLEDVGTSDARSAELQFAAVMQEESKVGYRALLALAEREPALLQPFLAPLLRRFQDPSDALGTEIAIVFRQLAETAPPELVTILAARLAGLGPNDVRACNLILLALDNMGCAVSKSAQAVEAIENATRHESSMVRDTAKRVLEHLIGS